VEQLQKYWEVYPTLRSELFTKSRDGYSNLNIEEENIRETIFSHAEFKEYTNKILDVFDSWKNNNSKTLINVKIGDKPKEIIKEIAEDLIDKFSNLKLVDKYNIYQHLMSYWNKTMQDDLYIIAANGWKAETSAILNTKGKEIGWESPLLPKSIVISKYFNEEKSKIDALTNEFKQFIEGQNLKEKETILELGIGYIEKIQAREEGK